MRVTLDMKPLERLARDIRDLELKFKSCRDQNERLKFLNTDGKYLQEYDPASYQNMVRETLDQLDDKAEKYFLGRIYYRYATTLHKQLDDQSAHEYFRKASEVAEELNDDILAVAVSEFRAQMLIYAGHAIQGLQDLQQVHKHRAKLTDQRSVLEKTMSSSMIASTAYLMTGQLLAAMRELRTFVEVGRKRGTDRSPYSIHSSLAFLLQQCGRYDEAMNMFQTGLQLERARKATPAISFALLGLARLDCERGTQSVKTAAYIQEARELNSSPGSNKYRYRVDIVDSLYLLNCGRAHEARALLQPNLSWLETCDWPEPTCECRLLAARALLDLGKTAEAQTMNSRALDLARAQQYCSFEHSALATQIKICRAVGEENSIEAIRNRRAQLEQYLHDQQNDPRFIEHYRYVQSELARQQLELELARTERLQDSSEKVKQERDSIQQRLIAKTIHLSNKNGILLELQTLLQKHMKQVATSARGEFRDLLRSTSEHLDSSDLWKDFEEEFSSVHADFLPALQNTYPKLTPTERKVCALMKLELPSKDVCRILRITQRSVETHRYNIRKKMGLDKQTSLLEAFAALT